MMSEGKAAGKGRGGDERASQHACNSPSFKNVLDKILKITMTRRGKVEIWMVLYRVLYTRVRQKYWQRLLLCMTVKTSSRS
jgi:hypothetical protein